jgi:hypothetical protein
MAAIYIVLSAALYEAVSTEGVREQPEPLRAEGVRGS